MPYAQVLSESINWGASVVEAFGLGASPLKSLLEWCKEDLASTNAAVRNSAIQMLGVAHRWGLIWTSSCRCVRSIFAMSQVGVMHNM